MSLHVLFMRLMPFLIPIILGYALARWMNLKSTFFVPFVRFIFLPLMLYKGMSGKLSLNQFMFLALAGVGVAAAGILLVRYGNRFIQAKINNSSGFPNVVYFTIPFLVVSMKSYGLSTASAFFFGAAVMYFLIHPAKNNIKILWKEPWIYAAIIGFVFSLNGYHPTQFNIIINPLLRASYPMMLVFLGLSLFPLQGIFQRDQVFTVLVRLLSGFAIALLAIKVLPLRGIMPKILMLAALAPPCTLDQVFGKSQDDSNPSASQLGILVSIILMGLILFFGWKPWRI